jgi:hypothetical protein
VIFLAIWSKGFAIGGTPYGQLKTPVTPKSLSLWIQSSRYSPTSGIYLALNSSTTCISLNISNTFTWVFVGIIFNGSSITLIHNNSNITSGYTSNSFDTFGWGHSYNYQYYAFVKAFNIILDNAAFEKIRKYDLLL